MIVTLELLSFKAKLYEISYQSNVDVHSINNKVLILYSMYSFANLADCSYIKNINILSLISIDSHLV